MSFFQSRSVTSLAWFLLLERSSCNVADPQGPHEFQTRPPVEQLCVPFSQSGVLGVLADDRILDECVTEMVNHRGDRENSTEPLLEALLCHDLFSPSSQRRLAARSTRHDRFHKREIPTSPLIKDDGRKADRMPEV